MSASKLCNAGKTVVKSLAQIMGAQYCTGHGILEITSTPLYEDSVCNVKRISVE